MAGRWSPAFASSLAGQSVLIVGYGSIGRRSNAGWPDSTSTSSRWPGRPGTDVYPASELPALLPPADVVVLLAPVTAQTVGMVDARFLAAMKDGALLVNGARGTLVQTDDLCDELASGRLFAALDVTDPEPLPAGHRLWTMENALITPHAAATTWLSATTVLGFLREQVLRYLGDDSSPKRHHGRLLSVRSAVCGRTYVFPQSKRDLLHVESSWLLSAYENRWTATVPTTGCYSWALPRSASRCRRAPGRKVPPDHNEIRGQVGGRSAGASIRGR